MKKLLLLLLLISATSWSATERDYLLVIASQRNAEVIADGARLFYEGHPERQELLIQARSDVQFWELTAAQRSELVAGSRGVLGFGLYGSSVANLVSLLEQSNKTQLLINSDHRLSLIHI